MKKSSLLLILSGIIIYVNPMASFGQNMPDDSLKVVIIRHGEKPTEGDNLSCQGENRALQLPAVLYKKFNKPNYTYIPSLKLGDATKHARMFQTVSPFAIAYNLTINSKFKEDDYSGTASDILTKKGTVLLVWEHSAIPDLTKSLGVKNPPDWHGSNFDSIWVITYKDGKASLATDDKEDLSPSTNCQLP